MIKFKTIYENEYDEILKDNVYCGKGNEEKRCAETIIETNNYSFKSTIRKNTQSLYPTFSNKTRNKKERFENKLIYKNE